MNHRLRLLAAVVAACSGALAQAEPHLRPGLWEESVTIKTDNAQANAAMEQMKARMAAMPPEQREAMEKMMASHGLGMALGGAPNAVRVCISKEQAERGFKPEDNGRCTRSNISNSGNSTTFDFACKSERGSITGHGTFAATGNSAFTMTSAADTVSQTATTHVQTDITGKFVSSVCGDVKPMTPPPAN